MGATMITVTVRPNLFIVGGPKCGTTSLYRYLRQHPDVYMSPRKEPHFFCPDLFSPRYVHDEAAYLALFSGAGGARRIGEASVYYLYSRDAAPAIRAFAPDAQIIIMLRNPVDMIYSLHSQRLYSGHEDIVDFEQALAAEPDRRQGRRLPPDPYPIPCLFYREIGRLDAQVQRYLDVFPRRQLHIIIFDEFVADTAGAFAATCEFLGIDPQFRPEFSVANPNKSVRSVQVRSWLRFSPLAKGLARAVLPKPMRQTVAEKLLELNRRQEPRRPMPRALRRQLQQDYASDVAALSALIGRDLTPWTQDPALRTQDP